MNIIKSFITKNDCYKANMNKADSRYTEFQAKGPRGLMLHSVGCNQPKASVFIKSWNQSGKEVAVHGVIDGLDGNTYQAMPWNFRGWHAGGEANNTHVGVEMGEPSCIKYTGGSNFTCSDVDAAREVAERTYASAVELFAMLCEEYDLDPLKDGVIISHKEGHKRGVASNHGDPEHLWNQLNMGYTMDTFRAAVKAKMEESTEDKPPVETTPTLSNEEIIWNFLKRKGLNDFAVAGLMGNLYAESGLRPNNLQNTYEKKLGMTDAAYTKAVDNGSYDNFVKDSAGYGLAQWTYYSRKQNLLDYAQAKGASIGDLQMQLDFLWNEIQKYKSVMEVLNTAESVREASDVVLFKYEAPADQSEKVQVKRAGYGQKYYDKFASTTPAAPITDHPEKLSEGYYRVRKTWEDSKSQLGAYKVLANAKEKADENPGYFVFDDAGNPFYPVADNSTPEVPATPVSDGNTRTIAYGKLNTAMNIRSTPSTDGNPITTYKKGTIVEVLQKLTNGWLRIKTESGFAFVSNTTGRYVSIGSELYIVVHGDSLWRIAQKKLGNGAKYPEIKTLNGMTSNTIYTGQKLLIS